MLRIKLARFGKNKQPHYRIVVNEARDKRDGQYVALLGHYAPTQTPKLLQIDLEAYQAWLKKGAQPTDTVNALGDRFASGNPFPERKPQLSKKAKAKAAAAAEAAAAPAAEEPVAETPTPDATPEEVTAEEPAAEVAPEATPETTTETTA